MVVVVSVVRNRPIPGAVEALRGHDPERAVALCDELLVRRLDGWRFESRRSRHFPPLSHINTDRAVVRLLSGSFSRMIA